MHAATPTRHHDPEMWVSLALMVLITFILLIATAIMMALGGVFIPFGFDTDFFTRLLNPITIGATLGVVALVVAVTALVSLRRKS
jgi:hypothetical protein